MRPDGEPVRMARMDADTTGSRGSLEAQLAQVHAGEVDVLVGTQMMAKGHDFRRITLVAAVNPTRRCSPATFAHPSAVCAC
jgi:primosomal protein N' (replication factor Y)